MLVSMVRNYMFFRCSVTSAFLRSHSRILTRAYSRDEWQSMSHLQRNWVFRERDRMETARTVAAILREEGSQNDDVSTITGTAFQGANGGVIQSNQTASVSGNTHSIGQVSLDNVGQAFSNRRCLNAIMSGTRKVNRSLGSFGSIPQVREEILHCHAKLDSHADTCGVNHIARVLEISGQVAEVSGFSNEMDSLQDIPIVKAAVAYDHPDTGEVIILVINQALYFGDKFTHILLNPNQMRSHNIHVDDVPKHLSSTSTHSIWVEEESLDIHPNGSAWHNLLFQCQNANTARNRKLPSYNSNVRRRMEPVLGPF
jgi:hypothetical protein